jgi:ferredoxin/coenzyme F420-reducing hydrogenase delta subunit
MNDFLDKIREGAEEKNGDSFREWEAFKTNVVKASEVSPDSTMRGRVLLDRVDLWFRKLDGFIARYIPNEYHPFTQSGAIANFTFTVAVVTGFVLLIWYSPSVHYAYDSVVSMSDKPYTAELTRSLHRYSSAACMLFILFHSLKVFFAGRFTGSRWLAWITGIVATGLIWFDGWLGYWLVWDERAELIATGTAKMLDVIPLFAEPLSASFLTDDSFNSVLFLIVFFMHMLIPIGFGIAIWLHVARLNKPGFFTTRNFSAVILFSLIAVSLIYPADTEGRAELMKQPADLTVDYFYLFPLLLTERLQGGILWLMFLAIFTLLTSVPWVMNRRKNDSIPEVVTATCNGCTQCFHDCPYNAISMLPREDEHTRKSDYVAWIDPSVCVSCGICVGSCDPVAINYPNLSPWEIRRKLDRWLDAEHRTLEGEYIAFVCGNSAGDSLTIEPETGQCREMPGYLVLTVPCAGWVHPTLIERALKKGAAGVLVAGCKSDPDFRLGADWLGSRIEGERHPEMRRDRFEMDRLLFLKMDKPEFKKFLNEAQRFRKGKTGPSVNKKQRRWKSLTAGVVLAGIIGALTVLPSSIGLPLAEQDTLLVVSFKMQGTPILTEEREDEQLLEHMRSQNRERVERRANVHLRTVTDGEVVFEDSYSPGGIFRRGYSKGLVKIPLEPGIHTLEIYLGDDAGEDIEWHHRDEQQIELEQGERVVLKFDEEYGFRWYTREE